MKILKNWVLISAWIVVLTACNNQTAQTETTQATNGPSDLHTKPQTPDNSSESALLQQNYWVWDKYASDDPNSWLFNRGRWFKFNPDGTFLSGHWEKTGAPGNWFLYRSNGKPILLLDSSEPGQDMEYELQLTRSGSEISWSGTSKYEASGGIMLLAINLLTIPTKKQFGVEE